mgnify:CR=1 FL=1
MYIDPYYIMLVVPTLIISLIAQAKVKSTFSKYSKQASKRGMSGAPESKFVSSEEMLC